MFFFLSLELSIHSNLVAKVRLEQHQTIVTDITPIYEYSENKIILTILHLRKLFPIKVYLYLIEFLICNSANMENKIYGPLVTVQYHAKCTNFLYPKLQAINVTFVFFTATFTWLLLIF